MNDNVYTKSRLLKELAYKVGIRQSLSQTILDVLSEIIYREAQRGGIVLPGLCKFDMVDKKARKIRNPRTGEILIVPPHRALRVTLSNLMKNTISPKQKAITQEEYQLFQESAAVAANAVNAEVPMGMGMPFAPMVKEPWDEEPVPEPEPTPAPSVEEPKAEESVPAPEPTPAPVVEEPKAEESVPALEPTPAPMVEEPKAEESVPAPEPAPAPAVEEPKAEESVPAPEPTPAPSVEEPKAEESVPAPEPEPAPVVEEPKAEESVPAPAPMAEEPKAEESVPAPEPTPAPAVEEPKAEEPVPAPEPTPAPAAEEPKAEESVPAPEPAPAPAVEEPKSEEVAVPANGAGAVSFRCPKCGQEIEAPSEVIGLEAECPVCGAILVVPPESEPGTMYGPQTDDQVARSFERVVSAKEAEDMDPLQLKNRTISIDTTLFGFEENENGNENAESSTPPVGEGKEDAMISFFCKNCHQEIEATSDMAGAQCECPNCGTSLEVPYFSDAGSIHDTTAAREAAQKRVEAQKHSTMRINLDDF